MKLKKSSRVKRTWEDDKMETVELKHHEFEQLPEEETPEMSTTVVLSEPIPDKEVDMKDKDKKKKKKKVIKRSLVNGRTNSELISLAFAFRNPRPVLATAKPKARRR